jgi:glyoxylase-like metal-dependent hydrolase (beta-lactamase superfamily II)
MAGARSCGLAMPVARLRPISRHIAAVDLHGRFQVAAFLVRHSDGLALVDAGFPGWQYAILTAAQSLPAPNHITHVVLTHAHSDHIGGASGIVAHMQAEVVCSAAERPYVEGRSLAHAAPGWMGKCLLTLHHHLTQRRVPAVRVDRTVEAGDMLCGMRVVDVPGHTPGQIALVHEADRVMLCGDALFNIRGTIGYEPVPGVTVDPGLAAASLEQIARLGVPDVVPSHGPAILGDAPARIDRFLSKWDRDASQSSR